MTKRYLFGLFQDIYEEVSELADVIDGVGDDNDPARRKGKNDKRKKTLSRVNAALRDQLNKAEEARRKGAEKQAKKTRKSAERTAENMRKTKEREEKRTAAGKKAREKAQEEKRKRAERQKAKAEKEARRAFEYEQKHKDREAERRHAIEQSRFHPRNPDYLPKTSFVAGPGIILKPLMDRVATGQEPIRLGGFPQLPAHIEWPGQDQYCNFHFYAQIDLGRLPRALSGVGYDFAMPRFPDQGTLFVFVPMQERALYEVWPELIYVREPVAHLPERKPPADLCHLNADTTSEIWPFAFEESGPGVRRQFAVPLPYMSTRAHNGTEAERALEGTPRAHPPEVTAALLNAGLEITLNEDMHNPEKDPGFSSWDQYVGQSTRVPPSEHAITSPHRFRHDFRQLQMFGHGDDMQAASGEKSGKIMLLQIGDRFGTPIMMTADVTIQIWITPEDLANGRFDRVEVTQHCT